jgi:glycerate dehydrogenase
LQSDFVVLLATLTEATRNMIGRREIAAMKPSAFLINVARGGLVDRNALVDALRSERIAGAGCDVYWSEPADPDDPLLSMPNFVLSPHVAGFSDISIDHVTYIIAENVRRLATGLPLLNVVAGPDSQT